MWRFVVYNERRFWPVVIQLGMVASGATFFTHLTDIFNYLSPLNLVWMIGLPAAIGFFSNKNEVHRLILIQAFVVLSLAVSIANAAIFGMGP